MSNFPLSALFKRLQERIRARPDTEFQQALIRFAIGVISYLYFSSSWVSHPEYIYSSIHFVALFFLSTATLILLGTLINLRASPLRRLCGAVVDFSTASFLLLIGGETSAPLVGIYLWVTLGNGFRYGVPYLYFSTVLATVGFGSVLTFNPFWHTHLALGIGILFTMVIVPLYAASLTRQLHSAVNRANEASQAKSNFLANMSHELRTPLNGVIGVADLLAETKLDKEQQEFSQIIRASANTLLEHLSHRGRAYFHRERRLRSAPPGQRHGSHVGNPGPKQGLGVGGAHRTADTIPPTRRCASPAPSPDQPDGQRHQIY